MTAITSLAATGGLGLQPTWTLDSSRIVFTFRPGGVVGTPEAAFINADGTEVQRVSSNGVLVRHPRLRPTP